MEIIMAGRSSEIDNLIAYFREQQKADKETIRQLHATIVELKGTIDSLNRLISEMKQSAEESGETIRRMQQTIDSLNEKISQMEEKLGRNSKNSSKPPSSDGYSKPPVPKSLRSKGGKKGAQAGHKGSTLMMTRKPDSTVDHMPAGCGGCPHYEECHKAAIVMETRNVLDASVTVTLTAHNRMKVACPMHNDSRTGDFPEGLNAYLQYGENLQGLAVALNTIGAVSLNRTSDILKGVFGIPITPATIGSMVRRCAGKTIPAIGRIIAGSVASGQHHGDETGFRVEGKLHWVHVLSDRLFTFLSISEKRGWKGMEEGGLLPRCHGMLTHDFWASYWHYDGFTHNVCRAHLLRELQNVTDNHPKQTWQKKFSDLLLAMKKAREKALGKGKAELSYSTRYRFKRQYDEIIENAYVENPEPEPSEEKKRGRKKRGKVLSLIDRLKNFKDSVCLIIDDLTAPFDNNLAERDLRMHKSKIKVSGCFRTLDGAKDYLAIMSCVSTGRKHGHNGYDVIMNLFHGSLDFMVLVEGS
jgi:transposase